MPMTLAMIRAPCRRSKWLAYDYRRPTKVVRQMDWEPPSSSVDPTPFKSKSSYPKTRILLDYFVIQLNP
jgi:hypothetical protein